MPLAIGLHMTLTGVGLIIPSAQGTLTGISMSGLLDKASAVKEAEIVETVAEKAPEPVTEKMTVTSSEQTFLNQASKIGLALGALGFIGMWFLDNYFPRRYHRACTIRPCCPRIAWWFVLHGMGLFES